VSFGSQFEETRRILVRAVAEIKGGEYLTARRYLERVLHLPASSDQRADAHFWLSEISETEEERRDHLQYALGYDLSHHRARRKLAVLDGRLQETEIVDPDKVAPSEERTEKREGNRFECPTCGGRMVYSPDGETLTCEYCSGEVGGGDPDELEEKEFVVGIAKAQGHLKTVAMQAFECEACGAVYLLGPQTLSMTCAHCDATYAIIQTEARDLIPPEGIVPMVLSKREVGDTLKNWAQSLGKSPPPMKFGVFKGVYLPAWTFDLGGQLRWTGYVEYQEGRPVPVRDYSVLHYDDVFIPASKPEPKRLGKLMRDFHADDVVPLKPDYLANWLAESYQVPMADAAVKARAVVYEDAKKKQVRKSGLENVQNLHFYSDGIVIDSFKLVLVPVWLGTYTLEGEEFEVLVNGKSGKVYAKKPPGRLGKLVDWLME
jgi:Zn finger protein HypA/HybF involved in hydrogenase expression